MTRSGEQRLGEILQEVGILLCNENPYLPSLDSVGGETGEMMGLVERREAFYCKVFRGRVTYLSREVYLLLKEVRHEAALDGDSLAIRDFLKEMGPAGTETIRNALLMGKDRFARALDQLLRNLCVTVLGIDKVLSPIWSISADCQASTTGTFLLAGP